MNFCRCRQWAECIGRYDLVNIPDEKLTKNYFLCGDHFDRSMFLNFEHNRLHINAIPKKTYQTLSSPFNINGMYYLTLFIY